MKYSILFIKRCASGVAAACALLVPIAANAATPYTLTGEFTTFRTWYDGALPATVNGIRLTDSGIYAGEAFGQAYTWSNTISLVGEVPTVEFVRDPQVVSPTSTVTSLPNVLDWVNGPSPVVDPGEEFVLGTLTFQNGQWNPIVELGVRFFADPSFGGVRSEWIDTLVLVSNSPPPPYTPEEQADYFYFTQSSALAGFRYSVYDEFSQPPSNPGSTGTFDVIAKIGSLDAVRLNPTNAAALVTAPMAPIPEPSAWALFMVGFAAFVASVSRRRAGNIAPLSART